MFGKFFLSSLVIMALICMPLLTSGILLLRSFHLKYSFTIMSLTIGLFFYLSTTKLFTSSPEINLSIYLDYFFIFYRFSCAGAVYVIKGFDLCSNTVGCTNFLLKLSAILDLRGAKLCNFSPASPKYDWCSSSILCRTELFGFILAIYLSNYLTLSVILSFLSMSFLMMPLRQENIQLLLQLDWLKFLIFVQLSSMSRSLRTCKFLMKFCSGRLNAVLFLPLIMSLQKQLFMVMTTKRYTIDVLSHEMQ